jgi:hypothetical protein
VSVSNGLEFVMGLCIFVWRVCLLMWKEDDAMAMKKLG